MAPPTELRLFISSTFRDLQEEREHLVKKIFPEIRALCRARGITFTEIDLRWGLTEDEGTYGRIIRTCLEEVDRCRPYFIGITGSRYGYIPDLLEIYKDPELLRLYPWVEEAVIEEQSITAMEVRYAVLDDPASAPTARFYFRGEPESLEEVDHSDVHDRLEELKQQIERSQAVVAEFRDPGSLGKLVYDDLIAIIRRDFADARAPTPLEQERSRHTAFAVSRRRAYIPNAAYLKRLNEWYAGDESPLVIYAESGSGKSSLVSYWLEQMRKKNPELFVVEHYVGIGAGDADHLGLIRHIMVEIRQRFDRQEDLPEKPEEIEAGLGQWLGYAVHGLRQQNTRMILILDGLNQLSESAQHLRWIPDVISPEIRLVLTSTIEETLIRLRDRGWEEMGMHPLSERERGAVIVRYLSEYHKELPGDVVERISTDEKCAHPLFLRTLLEELRLYGWHDRLLEHVDRLLQSTGTEDLFQHVLERIEADFDTRTVREVMSLLWGSREGLTEPELSEISGTSRLKLSTLLLGLDYHLIRRDGTLGFFHDYLQRAVAKRYLSDEESKRTVYRRLAAYFEGSEVGLRTTRELLGALENLGEKERLHAALSDIDRFRLLWEDDEYDLLRLWSGTEAEEVVAAYMNSRDRWERRSEDGFDFELAEQIAVLFDRLSALEPAAEITHTILEEAERRSDYPARVRALASLAMLARKIGNLSDAEGFAREAEEIALETGDRSGYARAVGSRGAVHFERGEYDEALKCFREQEKIAGEIGDRSTYGASVGNRGAVHLQRGEYDEALECYRVLESITLEVGDRRTYGYSVGNRGVIHSRQGEYEEALACYRQAESITLEIGDRRHHAIWVGNRGTDHKDRGEYEAALECFRQKETIALETGDRRAYGVSVGSRGAVHRERGEYEESLACLTEAYEVQVEVGSLSGMATWLLEIALVFLELALVDAEPAPYLKVYLPEMTQAGLKQASLGEARRRASECLHISRELGTRGNLFASQILLVRIDVADGRVSEAVETLQSLLPEAREDYERAALHYRLFELARDPSTGREHAKSALSTYNELYARTPRYDYGRRIDELTRAISEYETAGSQADDDV